MMRPVENFRFNQWLCDKIGKPFAWRIHVLAEIGMVNETFTADFQFASQLLQIRFYNVAVGMHKRIKTENEID